jgi:hypothetical protein
MAWSFDERARARDKLHELLKPGDVVTTVLFHVSASGMSRDIGVIIAREDRVIDITWQVAQALDYPLAKKQGLRVSGCGMDMGFHIVYALGSTLWPDGTKEPHGTRNGEPDRDGGYALKQEWL